MSDIVIDTSAAATDSIDYLATDNAGNVATSSKTKLIVCAPEFPIPFAVARARGSRRGNLPAGRGAKKNPAEAGSRQVSCD